MKNLYKFKINYTFKGGVFEDYGILDNMIKAIESNTEPSFKVKIPRWDNKKEWMSEITEVIKINKIIEEIQFDTASYNTDDIVDIANNFADIIRTNNTITNLFINYYNFGSQGTSLLADALSVNNTITDLTLSNNRIEGEGFKKLIDVLRTNNTIIKLNLEGNDINDDVVIHLANALLDNNTLTHLSLKSKGTESYFPKFGNDGILALAITLTTNTSITYLDIRDHNITQLPSQLSQNISITEFLYTGNPIDYIPPNVFFWLDRFQIQQDNTIAQDNQNVHNRKIQQSTLISYHNIINATPGIPSKDELTEIIKNHPTMKDIEDFDEELKNFLIDKSTCKNIHSTLHLTFAEALWYVFERIRINKNKEEIIKALYEEIIEDKNQNKCFTGTITRIINCLNVFDPLVKINLQSESVKIINIIKEINKNIVNEYREYEESLTTSSKEKQDIETFFINRAEEILKQNGIEVNQAIRRDFIHPIAIDIEPIDIESDDKEKLERERLAELERKQNAIIQVTIQPMYTNIRNQELESLQK